MSWTSAKTWTSQELVLGFRHFEIVTRGGKGADRWVELAPVLDSSQRFRVAWSELCDSSRWAIGWQQIVDREE